MLFKNRIRTQKFKLIKLMDNLAISRKKMHCLLIISKVKIKMNPHKHLLNISKDNKNNQKTNKITIL